MPAIHCTYITHFFFISNNTLFKGQVVGQTDRQTGIKLYTWIYKNSKCIDRTSVEENSKK